uniref:Uncharacterized protein n=1 Tax=Heterorhabditis bacteriophora TaxID=37862 RepID=A0A1I7W831_HETBA
MPLCSKLFFKTIFFMINKITFYFLFCCLLLCFILFYFNLTFLISIFTNKFAFSFTPHIFLLILGKRKVLRTKEFLEDANYYFNLSPANLIQTSAKLCLACVYALKDSFLGIGVFPASHNCMTFLVDFTLAHSSVTRQVLIRLRTGWEYAQE